MVLKLVKVLKTLEVTRNVISRSWRSFAPCNGKAWYPRIAPHSALNSACAKGRQPEGASLLQRRSRSVPEYTAARSALARRANSRNRRHGFCRRCGSKASCLMLSPTTRGSAPARRVESAQFEGCHAVQRADVFFGVEGCGRRSRAAAGGRGLRQAV